MPFWPAMQSALPVNFSTSKCTYIICLYCIYIYTYVYIYIYIIYALYNYIWYEHVFRSFYQPWCIPTASRRLLPHRELATSAKAKVNTACTRGRWGRPGISQGFLGKKMGGLSLNNRFHVKMGECTQPSRSWLKMDSIPWIYIAILIRKMLRNQSTNPFMKQNRHKNGDFANKGRIGKGCKSHGFGFPYIHFWGNPWETPGVQGKDGVSSKFSFHTIPEERANSQFQTVVHGFKYGAKPLENSSQNQVLGQLLSSI